MLTPRYLIALCLALTSAIPAAAAPLVLGHRGASAYRPEHTLAAYALAIDQGADYVEPDLVSTKDGVLVARHENYIGGDSSALVGADSTNVATRPEFASRKTTKIIDGVALTGWFTEDFTLAELKTLKARERIPNLRPGNTAFNDQFEVPTLEEVIGLVKAREAQTGRTIGIIPEIKHSTYFKNLGLAMEQPLVQLLAANGYDSANDAVIIQSFEVSNLQLLNTLTDVRLVQLTGGRNARPWDFTVSGDIRTYGDLLSAAGLDFINDYADLIGPEKSTLIPRDAMGNLLTPNSTIADAHAAGLLVTPYTFRPENQFLPANLRNGSNPAAYGADYREMLAFLNAGVDGIFVDAPDRGATAVRLFVAQVPEPATWAMLIAGFGFVGAAARTRRSLRFA
jgi:glycerophosphoryl diester phosphodiesterase